MPDTRGHAVRPVEVAAQTPVTVHLLSLSHTTASTAGNYVFSRSQ